MKEHVDLEVYERWNVTPLDAVFCRLLGALRNFCVLSTKIGCMVGMRVRSCS